VRGDPPHPRVASRPDPAGPGRGRRPRAAPHRLRRGSEPMTADLAHRGGGPVNEIIRRLKYVLHHCIAHPMLVIAPRQGAWLHDVTEPNPAPPVDDTSAPSHIPTGAVFVDELNVGDRVWMWGDFRTVVNLWALGSEVRVTFDNGFQIAVDATTLV